MLYISVLLNCRSQSLCNVIVNLCKDICSDVDVQAVYLRKRLKLIIMVLNFGQVHSST